MLRSNSATLNRIHQSFNRSINSVRGLKEHFPKACARMGFAAPAIAAEPKHICSTLLQPWRLIYNGWWLGGTICRPE